MAQSWDLELAHGSAVGLGFSMPANGKRQRQRTRGLEQKLEKINELLERVSLPAVNAYPVGDNHYDQRCDWNCGCGMFVYYFRDHCPRCRAHRSTGARVANLVRAPSGGFRGGIRGGGTTGDASAQQRYQQQQQQQWQQQQQQQYQRRQPPLQGQADPARVASEQGGATQPRQQQPQQQPGVVSTSSVPPPPPPPPPPAQQPQQRQQQPERGGQRQAADGGGPQSFDIGGEDDEGGVDEGGGRGRQKPTPFSIMRSHRLTKSLENKLAKKLEERQEVLQRVEECEGHLAAVRNLLQTADDEVEALRGQIVESKAQEAQRSRLLAEKKAEEAGVDSSIIMGETARKIENALATFLSVLPKLDGTQAAGMVVAINDLRAFIGQQEVGADASATGGMDSQPADVGKQPPPPSNVGLGGPGSSYAAPLSPPPLGAVRGKSAAAEASLHSAAAAAAAAQRGLECDLDVDDDWKGETDRPAKQAKADPPPPGVASGPPPTSPAGQKPADGSGQAGEEVAVGVLGVQRQSAAACGPAPGACGGQAETPQVGTAIVDGDVEMGVSAQGRQEAAGAEDAPNRFRRRRPEDAKDDTDGDGRERSRTPPRSEAASAASGAAAAAQVDTGI